MMSIMALTGYAFGGSAVAHKSGAEENEFLYEQDLDDALARNALRPETLAHEPRLNDVGALQPKSTTPMGDRPDERFDFDRGDRIDGFDLRSDILELEYTAALGTPEITINDFPDGSGASIALNGVVVADISGAKGLNTNSIRLIAV